MAENGVDVLKELFTSCAGLNYGRAAGLFGFIYKVCHILFNGVVDLFVDRLAASSVRQRVGSGLAETEQDQLFSFPMEVTHKNWYHDNGHITMSNAIATNQTRRLIKRICKACEAT